MFRRAGLYAKTPRKTPHRVAIPSVRVSVFRLASYPSASRLSTVLLASQSPRFGSRCFVLGVGKEQDAVRTPTSCRNPLGSGLGVSSVLGEEEVVRAMRAASQSPRFGSRCFVVWICQVLYTVGSLYWSQAPRFGSRCFVSRKPVTFNAPSGGRSQSPRFGSRCFVLVGLGAELPAPRSQSPRFGSRCFVEGDFGRWVEYVDSTSHL